MKNGAEGTGDVRWLVERNQSGFDTVPQMLVVWYGIRYDTIW